MPVLTPFGEVTLGDPVSLGKWSAAHAAKHQQYVVEHIGPGGGILDEPIDGDWMLRHTARHVSLATAARMLPNAQLAAQIPPLSSANTKVLSLPGIWKTDAELQDWHALHNRLHSLIDQVRQIAGHQAKPNINAGVGPPAMPGIPPNIKPPPPGRPGPQP
jgi:hypothetical protein